MPVGLSDTGMTLFPQLSVVSPVMELKLEKVRLLLLRGQLVNSVRFGEQEVLETLTSEGKITDTEVKLVEGEKEIDRLEVDRTV